MCANLKPKGCISLSLSLSRPPVRGRFREGVAIIKDRLGKKKTARFEKKPQLKADTEFFYSLIFIHRY